MLSALAAVVISLMPIGSSASRERERERERRGQAASLESLSSYASVATLPADPPLSDWEHIGPYQYSSILHRVKNA